jgi:hypothetical protein
MTLPLMASSQAVRDSLEIAVLRVAATRPQRADSVTVVLTPVAGTFWCDKLALADCVRSKYFRMTGTDTVGLGDAAREAAVDLAARSDSLSTEIGRRVSARLSSSAKSAQSGAPDRCSAHGELALTRVGFDASKTVAVVAYRITVGPGPYPGCGWINTGGMVLRRNAQNSWEIVGGLPGIIT